jgi:hypothetical protein
MACRFSRIETRATAHTAAEEASASMLEMISNIKRNKKSIIEEIARQTSLLGRGTDGDTGAGGGGVTGFYFARTICPV